MMLACQNKRYFINLGKSQSVIKEIKYKTVTVVKTRNCSCQYDQIHCDFHLFIILLYRVDGHLVVGDVC